MQDMEAMADKLAARTAGSLTGDSPVGAWWPDAGQEQTGPPKGGGLMRMLGGDSTGEATGSAAADRVRNALRPTGQSEKRTVCQPLKATLAVVPACRRLTHRCAPAPNPTAAIDRSI